MWRHNHAHEHNGTYLEATMVQNKLFAQVHLLRDHMISNVPESSPACSLPIRRCSATWWCVSSSWRALYCLVESEAYCLNIISIAYRFGMSKSLLRKNILISSRLQAGGDLSIVTYRYFVCFSILFSFLGTATSNLWSLYTHSIFWQLSRGF